jgi:DNA repair protein RecO (recombination protein O)
MIEKTKGIVLHQIKYSDSGIVAQMYTRKNGRQSFLIRGVRNKKGGKQNLPLQPLLVLDLVMYNKGSRSMQTLKELSVSYAPAVIFSDLRKSCIAIFIAEVLTSVLREESPNTDLFDYIEESVIYFDRTSTGVPNFHIAFLSSLAGFLGFEPAKREHRSDKYFDMLDGRFVRFPPVHGLYAGPEVSDILATFFNSSFEEAGKICLTGAQRNETLETIIRYFSIHLPGLKKINSISVMKDIFS